MLMTSVCDASDRGKAAILWHRGSMTENRDDGVYSHGAGHMYHVLHSAHIDAIDGRPLAWIEKVGNGSAQCSALGDRQCGSRCLVSEASTCAIVTLPSIIMGDVRVGWRFHWNNVHYNAQGWEQ